MRVLVDASLPRSVKAVLEACSIESLDVRDIGLGDASDSEIAAHAERNGLVLLTGDFDFADIRRFPLE